MKSKGFLPLLAVTAALITSLSLPISAAAVSRTTTTELLGTGATAEEAVEAATQAQNIVQQVLGARRNNVAGNVSVGEITDKAALATLNDLELFAKLISEYTHQEIKASDITILDSMEVVANANVVVSDANHLFVTFGFPSIIDSTEAYVFHYGETGWQIVPTTVVEGLVTGEFSKLSPVAIVAKTDTLKGAVRGASRKKSPRTGDYTFIILAGSIAVLGIAGSVSRKALNH